MSRDWTKEELQAASDAMKAMGFPSYEEFLEALEKMNQAQPTPIYRYYILVPHMSADRLPAGYTRFERWNSRPRCRDARQEAFGIVEYSRPLTIKEMTAFGLSCRKI